MPIISVIVPVYKVEAYLQKCVSSILTQTFTGFELILVDDGSPDKCPDICDSLALQDKRIHVIHIPHSGLSAARNAGLDYVFRCSDSQYISFIDSDDWVSPNYLEWLYDAVLKNEGAIAAGKIKKVTDPFVFADNCQVEVISPEQLYCNSITDFIIACNKLYPRSCFDELRFPEGKLCEDEFIIWKIMFRFRKIAVLSSPVYAYFQRRDSIMGTWTPGHLSRLAALDEQRKWIELNCGEAARIKVRQRMAVVYAEEIRGMVTYGYPTKEIRQYKRILRSNISKIRRHLPLFSNKAVYITAWPFETKVMYKIRALLRKAYILVNKKPAG